MIVVRVELWSAVTGQVTELARMRIANESGGGRLRDYSGVIFKGRSREALERGHTHRCGRVEAWPAEELHVWNLVAEMLAGMGYGRAKR